MPQDSLFADFDASIERWAGLAAKAFNGRDEPEWSRHRSEYGRIQAALQGVADEGALRAMIREVCEGVIHSVLATIDGEGTLPPMKLVDLKTGRDVSAASLHERFIAYLVATRGSAR